MAEYALMIAKEVMSKKLDSSQDNIQYLIINFEHLEYIFNLLRHLEGHLYHSMIQNLISEVIGCVYEAEDLAETLVLQSEFPPLFIRKFLDKWSSVFPKEPLYRLIGIKSAIDIQRLHQKIDDIVKRFQTYGVGLTRDNGLKTGSHESASVNNDQHSSLRERGPRSRGSNFKQKVVIGLEEQITTLVVQLLNPPTSSTVCITGMGGIGKTTLAQCIYNHKSIIDFFEVRGWVSISQKFTPKTAMIDLLMVLITSDGEYASVDLQRLQESQLKIMIYEFLLRKTKYLIILDDVWSIQVWDFFIGAFPKILENGSKSRLVLTTRSKQVARHTNGVIHQMSLFHNHLNSADSWKLFHQSKTFEVQGEDPELEDIGKDIISKCEGLPLVIVGVGSFLSKKTWTREWQRVLTTMTPLGPRGKVNHVSAIFALSYKDLSPQLKSCFLHFGFFPRGTEIPTRKLFNLWAAYGLEWGETYLEELIEKNLVEAGNVGLDGKVKTCLIHPSIHELSVLMAKEEISLEVQSANDPLLVRPRHKVVLLETKLQIPSSLRSLLFYLPPRTQLPIEKPYLVFKKFKWLRVLDLESLLINDPKLPATLGSLQNLRFLNLRNTKGIMSLNSSMRKLHMLLMLDIKGSEIGGGGGDVGLGVLKHMTSLQHVYLGKCGDYRSLELGTLMQLQSIGWISERELLANKMQKLTLVRKLKLRVSTSSMEEIWSSLASMGQLESLYLAGEEKGTIIPLPHDIANSILNIKQLTLQLINVSVNLRSFLAQFPNLSFLSLKESDIEGEIVLLETTSTGKIIEFLFSNTTCRLVRTKKCQCQNHDLSDGKWNIDEASSKNRSIIAYVPVSDPQSCRRAESSFKQLKMIPDEQNMQQAMEASLRNNVVRSKPLTINDSSPAQPIPRRTHADPLDRGKRPMFPEDRS